MIKRRVTLFLFLISIAKSFGQQLSYKNYSVKEGLPSSVVYDLLQDSNGFIWFATEAGVSKFDGTSFHNYTTADGLSDNDVLSIYEDSKGRLWFLTFSGIPSYYYKSKFYSLSAAFTGNKQSLVNDIFEDSEGAIWFSTLTSGVFKYINGELKRLSSLSQSLMFYKRDTSNGRLLATADSLYIINIKNDKIIKKPIRPEGFEITRKGRLFSQIIKFNEGFIGLNQSKGLFQINDSIISLIKSKEDISKEYKINSLFGDRGSLWVATSGGALYYPKNILNSGNRKFYCEGNNISNILRDREGNMWFTTQGKGVFYLPSEEITNYTQKDNLPEESITCINGNGRGTVWIGTGNGSISKIEKGVVEQLYDEVNKGSKVYDILSTSQSVYFGGNGITGPGIPQVSYGSVKSLTGSPDKKMYAASSGGLFEITKTKAENIGSSFGLSRTTSVFIDKSNKLWIGSNNGLYSLQDNFLNFSGEKEPLLRAKVTDIQAGHDGTVWIATYENGIIGIKDKKRWHVSTHNGLHSGLCKSIFIDDSDNIWVATNKGAYKIKFSSDRSLFTVYRYSSSDGLISDEVTGIYKEKDQVWIATLNGISVFNESRIRKTFSAPVVHVTGVTVYGRDVLSEGALQLEHSNNDIGIRYIGLSYQSQGNIMYKYLLTGHMQKWTYTSVTEAQFYSLSPGDYRFLVYAQNAKGIWSKDPARLSFTILPAFYQTWWFKILVAVTILMTMILLFLTRLRNIKKKERQRTALNKKLAELKLTALRAQMNPHFIFNSLTSIRRFIHANDPSSAEKYITDFAHLLRLILNNSDKEFIRLEDEIKILKAYLECESLRFVNRFEYAIQVDSELDTQDLKIPPLIIQPYLENAIQHGFTYLVDRKGILKISFNLEGDILKCIIEDNGVGRKKAVELKEPQKVKYQSKGMDLSHERLQTLNILKEAEMKVEVTDLEHNGESIGTRITVFIPVN